MGYAQFLWGLSSGILVLGISGAFWWGLALGPPADSAGRGALATVIAVQVAGIVCFVYLARALRRRPMTLELLAWECSHRSELTMVLEETRERWSGALLAEVQKSGVQLPQPLVTLAVVLSAAIHYLAVRGRDIDVFSGLEIGSDTGWHEIENVIAGAFSRRR
jgi:hypothetical protein